MSAWESINVCLTVVAGLGALIAELHRHGFWGPDRYEQAVTRHRAAEEVLNERIRDLYSELEKERRKVDKEREERIRQNTKRLMEALQPPHPPPDRAFPPWVQPQIYGPPPQQPFPPQPMTFPAQPFGPLPGSTAQPFGSTPPPPSSAAPGVLGGILGGIGTL